jgi:lysophospholipase L1-like esterase
MLVAGVIGIITAGCAATPARRAGGHNPPPLHSTSRTTLGDTTSTTTTSEPATTTTTTLPTPAPGFVAGHVTAVGDSVMLDYQTPLEADIPGVDVEAAVSRQWGAGEDLLAQLKAEGQLGAEVIVALGTNGPITTADFTDMMTVLQGASRIVFVNIHVDRPWQDPDNAVLAQGAASYPRVLTADWATLAGNNPQWFGPDGTHLAIDGPGAEALASLIAATLSNG